MDDEGKPPPGGDSVESQQLLQLRIREVNTDNSLSCDEKAREVSRLRKERNEAFLKGFQARGKEESEPPVKRHVKNNQDHSHCGIGCGSAADGDRRTKVWDVENFSHVRCEVCTTLLEKGLPRASECKGCSAAAERAKIQAFYQYVRSFKGKFPGRNAKPCHHYERHCWLLAKCCGRYYPCRRCHDEIEVSHDINRHDTEYVGCSRCGSEEQPAEEGCVNCGVQFARYFCKVCRFYDDNKKPVYHCEHCGICRMGKGVGIDQHHCHRCKSCVPIEVADKHPCMDSSVKSDCPVCRVFMATSTEQVLFMRCGHAMHANCFERYTKVKYNCPLCFKALTNMDSWYRALDVRLAQEVMPPEYNNRCTNIICHDCDLKSVAKFHFNFHKCYKCNGYNTRVLSYFNLSAADARECEKHKARVAAADESKEGFIGKRDSSVDGAEKKSGSQENDGAQEGACSDEHPESRENSPDRRVSEPANETVRPLTLT